MQTSNLREKSVNGYGSIGILFGGTYPERKNSQEENMYSVHACFGNKLIELTTC